MRILYVTAVSGTMDFFVNTITKLVEEGHTVDLACNTKSYPLHPRYCQIGCRHYEIDCGRTLSFSIIKTTIAQLKQIVQNGNYDVVHCHTPIAAVCTRIACRNLRKKGLKVVYTAHGFHFYKGAPTQNWLIFYPVEKICSYITDTMITINTEDYQFAQRKLHPKELLYIPGVGIDTKELKNTVADPAAKRKEIGVPTDAKMILSVGNLNENKNHQLVIRALGALNKPNVYYVIAGSGDNGEKLTQLAHENGVNLLLLGLRDDVPGLQLAADFYIHPSYREGLSVSIMEAMALGKAVACGHIRGNVDLIDDEGGTLFSPFSVEECKNAIQRIVDNKELREQMGRHNTEKIEFFSQEKTIAQVMDVYQNLS